MTNKSIDQVLVLLETTHDSGNIAELEYQNIKTALEFQKISAKYSSDPSKINVGGTATTTNTVFDFLKTLNAPEKETTMKP